MVWYYLLLFSTLVSMTTYASSPTSNAVGSLGLGTASYFGSLSDDRNPVFSSLHAKWFGVEQGRLFEVAAQAELNLTINKMSYYSVEFAQVYAGTSRRLSSVQLLSGRKLVSWNQLDERWKLGVWQPCFRWDYLNPETVGLIGAFLTINQPIFQAVLFGSPIFIPERGAPIEFKDGRVRSDSPWFLQPNSTVNVFGQNTKISYSLAATPVQEIIAHPGAGAMARIGEKEGPWTSAAYAYKPMNQLLMGYDGYLSIPSDSIIATIYPRVAYHHVGSVEAGFSAKPVSAWLSVFGERPERDMTPASWTTQEVSQALAVGSAIDFEVYKRGRYVTVIDMSYLRQWGGDAPDTGPLASDGMSSFESRYRFKHALTVGLRTPFHGLLGRWSRDLSANSRVTYDTKSLSQMVSTELKYRAQESWTVGVGADLLTSGPAESSSDPDFISKYRSNDRIHGGVTYAF